MRTISALLLFYLPRWLQLPTPEQYTVPYDLEWGAAADTTGPIKRHFYLGSAITKVTTPLRPAQLLIQSIRTDMRSTYLDLSPDTDPGAKLAPSADTEPRQLGSGTEMKWPINFARQANFGRAMVH